MKKPYIKKYCRISRFDVWIVDGKYVRDNIDQEFPNYGQHYRFNFIPENEIWFDKDCSNSKEEEFYLIRLIAENRLMGESIVNAGELEKKARLKSKRFSEFLKIRDRNGLLEKVHKRLLKNYSKYLHVWLVRGSLVRTLFYIDFVAGGHEKIYSFIPKREIWIDDALSKEERELVLLHELYERRLMLKGRPYDFLDKIYFGNGEKISVKPSHWLASKLELYCRKHPEKLGFYLKREIELNKK